MNKIFLLGNLTRDPELKHVSSGASVCSFGLATSETWKDKLGGTQEKTEFHNIKVWGKQAESCNKFLAKGHKALVEGKIEYGSYENKEGHKVYTTDIKALNVQFLSSSKSKQAINEDTSLDQAMQIAKESLAEKKNENLFDAAKIKQEQLFDTDDIPF